VTQVLLYGEVVNIQQNVKFRRRKSLMFLVIYIAYVY